MSFGIEQVKKQAREYGSEIGPIYPKQNWVKLTGVFTPAQLRIIAQEIEDRWDKPLLELCDGNTN